jgi:O-acetyl-ADP-ribose deacetylase (regulator of RNase III)
MVHTVKGDVFESNANIIAHGVNCKGGFGSGVAGLMAKKHPSVRNGYLTKFKSEGWKLGDVQFVHLYDHRSSIESPNKITYIVANCATQNNYLPRGERHADYDAIKTCMEKVKQYAKEREATIAIPKIGAGLAGGDWGIIEKILKEVFIDYDITVYYLG